MQVFILHPIGTFIFKSLIYFDLIYQFTREGTVSVAKKWTIPVKLFAQICQICMYIVTSESKKPRQIAVVYHYCDLSRFFWLRRYILFRWITYLYFAQNRSISWLSSIPVTFCSHCLTSVCRNFFRADIWLEFACFKSWVDCLNLYKSLLLKFIYSEKVTKIKKNNPLWIWQTRIPAQI